MFTHFKQLHVCLCPPPSTAERCICTPSTNLTVRNNLSPCTAANTLPGMCLMTPEFVCHTRWGPQIPSEKTTWVGKWANSTDKRVRCAALACRELEEPKWLNDQTPAAANEAVDDLRGLYVFSSGGCDTAHNASSSPPSRRDGTPTAEGDLGSLNQHSWQSNLARLSRENGDDVSPWISVMSSCVCLGLHIIWTPPVVSQEPLDPVHLLYPSGVKRPRMPKVCARTDLLGDYNLALMLLAYIDYRALLQDYNKYVTKGSTSADFLFPTTHLKWNDRGRFAVGCDSDVLVLGPLPVKGYLQG